MSVAQRIEQWISTPSVRGSNPLRHTILGYIVIALIDSDIIAYSVGFAAKDDPLPYALHSVNKMIDSMLERAGVPDGGEYFCFLTGSGNYREAIATIAPYKGNRKTDKPTHFYEIREYLVNKHGALVVDGAEADDAIGIMQTRLTEKGIESCICSIDKDLDMIAGWHYNWKRDEKYFVRPMDAELFFYKQLLMGDSTDNIKGIPNVGDKKASKLITTIIEECAEDGTVDVLEELYWEILTQYAIHYDRPMEALLENARLLWIRRNNGELWEPLW